MIILFLVVIFINLRSFIFLVSKVFHLWSFLLLTTIGIFDMSFIFLACKISLFRFLLLFITFRGIYNDRSLKLSLNLMSLKDIVSNHETLELIMICVIDCDINDSFHEVVESLEFLFIQWTVFIYFLLSLLYFVSNLNLLKNFGWLRHFRNFDRGCESCLIKLRWWIDGCLRKSWLINGVSGRLRWFFTDFLRSFLLNILLFLPLKSI